MIGEIKRAALVMALAVAAVSGFVLMFGCGECDWKDGCRAPDAAQAAVTAAPCDPVPPAPERLHAYRRL